MDQIKVHFIQIQIRNQITTTIHPTTDGFPNRAVIPQEIRWVFCNVCLTKTFFQMSSQLLNDLMIFHMYLLNQLVFQRVHLKS